MKEIEDTSWLSKAVIWHKNKWPKELISGIMFFEGHRITKQMFDDYIRGK